MMCNKIEALKVEYQDQAEILDNDTIVMHLFLVCAKLYKLELMENVMHVESMGINKINIPRRTNLRKGNGTKIFLANAIIAVR